MTGAARLVGAGGTISSGRFAVTVRLTPGHDYKGQTVTTVAEEKQFNPRLGASRIEQEFVWTMDNLNLSYPRHIDRVLPANLNLGREPWDTLQRSDGDRVPWVAVG